MSNISIPEVKTQTSPTIKIIGIGGGGCNALNTMIEANLSDVELIAMDTDLQFLNANLAKKKIQLGTESNRGMGAGADPKKGMKAAQDEYEKISQVLADTDIIFITAGMGGGTGTGAIPVIAKIAKKLEAITIGIVTRPFSFEGKKRAKVAHDGIEFLKKNVDALIIVSNQKLLSLAKKNLNLIEAFKIIDSILLNAVKGISSLIKDRGFINADLADFKTVILNKGLSLIGSAQATGEGRAVKAATQAMNSPLLEDVSIVGATGIIINITGSSNLTLQEINEAITLVTEVVNPDAEIIWGIVVDESFGNSIQITVIATGIFNQTTAEHADSDHNFIGTSTAVSTLLNDCSDNNDNSNGLFEKTLYEEKKVTTVDNLESNHGKGFLKKEEIHKSLANQLDKINTVGISIGMSTVDEEELDSPSYLRK